MLEERDNNVQARVITGSQVKLLDFGPAMCEGGRVSQDTSAGRSGAGVTGRAPGEGKCDGRA